MVGDTPVDNTTGGVIADPNGEPEEKPVIDEVEQEETTAAPEEVTPENVESQEEPFTTSVDPTKLAPELQALYKQMQADYTRKTQGVAGLRRAAEAYERFRPYLTKVFSDPNLTKQVLGQAEQPAAPEEVLELPEDPREFAEYVKKQTLDEVNRIVEEREKIRELETQDYQDRMSAETVDPRLSDLVFAKQIAAIVNNNQDYAERRLTAVEATKQAIKDFDDYVMKVVNQKNQEIVKKAKSSTGVSVSSGHSTSSPTKALSIHDAWKQAEEEIAQRTNK